MNFIKRVSALFLVAIIASAMILPAVAAETNNVTAYAGGSATVTFTISNIYSLDGEFAVNGSGIVSDYTCYVKDRGGMKGGNVNGISCYLYDTDSQAKARQVTLAVEVQIKDTAQVGDSVTVIFNYEKCTSADGSGIESGEESAKITIEKKAETTPTTPTTAPTTSTNTNTNTNSGSGSGSSGTSTNTNTNTGTSSTNKNNNTTNTNSTSKDTNTNSTKVTEPETKMDYEELNRQINIAKGLKEEDYDAETWKEFQEVLKKAESLTDSTDQEAVDTAADELSDTIVEMVGVDYSKLREAIDSVALHTETPVLSGLWYQMVEVLRNAEEALESTDQATVDAAALQIETLLAEIDAAVAELEPGTLVEEVPIEVEPEGDYCNISMHSVWPILFFVSLALNIGFSVLIVVYMIRKKKNQKDDTPLVDYDIDDEFDDLDDLEETLAQLDEE